MTHKETIPEIRQKDLPRERILTREQLDEFSKEDLNKYISFETELRQREMTLEFKKREILDRRNRALEVSMFADEILSIPCKVEQEEIEGMLMGQALILQEFFRVFVGRMDLDDSIDGKATYGKLALTAQNLGRKTLGTLIELKHPRRSNTFIKKQQNTQINMNSDKQTSEN